MKQSHAGSHTALDCNVICFKTPHSAEYNRNLGNIDIDKIVLSFIHTHSFTLEDKTFILNPFLAKARKK